MATLFYGSDTTPVALPDRLMGYIKVIAATKLRRNESFTLTWTGQPGAGRETIWLQPSIPLRFVFESTEPDQLVGEYLRLMADQSNSSSGLMIDLATWEDAEAAARPAARPVRAA